MVDPASIDLMLAKAGPVEISRKSRKQPMGKGSSGLLYMYTQCNFLMLFQVIT